MCGAKKVGVRLMGNPGHNRVVTCSDVLACLEGFSQENWEDITNLFTAITEHLGDLTQAQWEAITNLFLAITAQLEGSYTTWTFLDKVAVRTLGAADETLILVDDLGNVHYYNSGAEPTYNIWDKTLTLQVGAGLFPSTMISSERLFEHQSLRRKYTCLLASDTLYVLRNYPIVPNTNGGWGALFEREIVDDWAGFTGDWSAYQVSISPSGKYIAVLIQDIPEGEAYIMLYEGS